MVITTGNDGKINMFPFLTFPNNCFCNTNDLTSCFFSQYETGVCVGNQDCAANTFPNLFTAKCQACQSSNCQVPDISPQCDGTNTMTYYDDSRCQLCKSEFDLYRLDLQCEEMENCYVDTLWPDSTDLENKFCNTCHSSCPLTCVGGTSNDCTQCHIGTSLKYYYGVCYTTCPLGTEANRVYTCEIIPYCISPCLGCQTSPFNGTICLSCISGTYLLGDKCVEESQCPDSTYPNLVNRSCSSCPIDCLLCIDYDACTACKQLNLLYNGTCLSECPENTYEQVGSCYDCVAPCKQCKSLTQCITCDDNAFKDSLSLCVLECPEGQYGEVSTGYCQYCSIHCQNCTGPDNNECTSCPTQKILHNNYCVGSCPIHYEDNSDSTECVRCKYECMSTSCSVGYREICLESCPQQTYSVLQSESYYYCYNCSEECESCQGSEYNECLTCPDSNPVLFNGQCLKDCQYGNWNEIEKQCEISVTPMIKEIKAQTMYILVFENDFSLENFVSQIQLSLAPYQQFENTITKNKFTAMIDTNVPNAIYLNFSSITNTSVPILIDILNGFDNGLDVEVILNQNQVKIELNEINENQELQQIKFYLQLTENPKQIKVSFDSKIDDYFYIIYAAMSTSIDFSTNNSYNWTLQNSTETSFILKFTFENSFGNQPLLTVTIDLDTKFKNNLDFVMVNKESTLNLISYDKSSDNDTLINELASAGKQSAKMVAQINLIANAQSTVGIFGIAIIYMATMIKFLLYIDLIIITRYIKVDYPENVRNLLLQTGDAFYSGMIPLEIEENYEEINQILPHQQLYELQFYYLNNFGETLVILFFSFFLTMIVYIYVKVKKPRFSFVIQSLTKVEKILRQYYFVFIWNQLLSNILANFLENMFCILIGLYSFQPNSSFGVFDRFLLIINIFVLFYVSVILIKLHKLITKYFNEKQTDKQTDKNNIAAQAQKSTMFSCTIMENAIGTLQTSQDEDTNGGFVASSNSLLKRHYLQMCKLINCKIWFISMKEIKSQEYFKHFDVIYFGFKVEKVGQRLCLFVNLIRMYLFAMIIAMFSIYPIFVLITLMIINACYLAYLVILRPFNSKGFLISEIIVETLILLEIVGVLILAIQEQTDYDISTRMYIGWYVVIVILLIMYFQLVYQTICLLIATWHFIKRIIHYHQQKKIAKSEKLRSERNSISSCFATATQEGNEIEKAAIGPSQFKKQAEKLQEIKQKESESDNNDNAESVILMDFNDSPRPSEANVEKQLKILSRLNRMKPNFQQLQIKENPKSTN